MRKYLPRIILAVLMFTLSVLLSYFANFVRQQPPVPAMPCPTLTVVPSSAPALDVAVENHDSAEFPDSAPVTPWEISSFIDNHPSAKLEGLWKRLHVKPDENHALTFLHCAHCTTSTNDYDLDGEPGNETLLKISDELGEAYRYLLFKSHDNDRWTCLGYADAWGKYRQSEAMVVVSDGKTWLLVQGQSASGSGVAFYSNALFEVTSRMNLVLSYESEGHQSGYGGYPTEEFSTRVLSCRSYGKRTEVKIEYQIKYTFLSSHEKYKPLFTVRRIATFIKQPGQEASVDERSTMSRRELDAYHIDAMTESDFLKYNRVELVTLATKGTRDQKLWLKSYLASCDKSAVRTQLLTALRN